MPTVENPPHFPITTLALEYPLMLALVPGLNELCLWDCEYSEEYILCFALTDEQVKAIQERKSPDVSPVQANILDQDRDLVVIDAKKGFILDYVQNQLSLGNLIEPAHEDLYTILLTLTLSSDQCQMVQDAMCRAEIYRLTHDDDGNLIIPQVTQPEIAYA